MNKPVALEGRPGHRFRQRRHRLFENRPLSSLCGAANPAIRKRVLHATAASMGAIAERSFAIALAGSDDVGGVAGTAGAAESCRC